MSLPKQRYLPNTPLPINSNTTYTIIGYHRTGPTKEKSRWDIPYHQEVNCFIQTLNLNWIETTPKKRKGWGLFKPIIKIGIGVLPKRDDLYVAEFVDSSMNNHWHGYPIDYTNIDHRVPDTILDDWEKHEFISKTQNSRMQRGFECL